ncbi:MAG: ribbon-helix-helix domain-containing protein [Thermoanaerobaculales bacterium]|nr:ribbon-helix-helix domain-containing protein [Thermoanaerobaculales bacterium]
MNRTTIMLPEELKRQVQERAMAAGISFGELVRRSLTTTVSTPPPERAEDPLFADSGTYLGEAPSDLSEEHDQYLYEEVQADG